MYLNEAKIGDYVGYGSRMWGGGSYPLIVLEITGYTALVQHPNGKTFRIIGDVRVKPTTAEEFQKMESQFDKAFREGNDVAPIHRRKDNGSERVEKPIDEDNDVLDFTDYGEWMPSATGYNSEG